MDPMAPRGIAGRGSWSVRSPPFGRPLTHCQGSGGQVRAPCPIAVLGTDDFQPRVAITFACDPQFGRSDGLRQIQQLGVATEVVVAVVGLRRQELVEQVLQLELLNWQIHIPLADIQ